MNRTNFPKTPDWVALGYVPEPQRSQQKHDHAGLNTAFSDYDYEQKHNAWVNNLPAYLRTTYDEYLQQVDQFFKEMDEEFHEIDRHIFEQFGMEIDVHTEQELYAAQIRSMLMNMLNEVREHHEGIDANRQFEAMFRR